MRLLCKVIALIFAVTSLSYGASLISGSVKGPDGSPFRGAFVRARSEQTKITVNVLSDSRGMYRITDLKPGEYDVQATAVGYKGSAQHIKVDTTSTSSMNFVLEKGVVRWTDVSIEQARALLPDGPGKKALFTTCMQCHGIQNKIAGSRRTEGGWRTAVSLMQDIVHGVGDPRITDQAASEIVPYLTKVFGVNSTFTQSPAELPGYEKVKHAPFSDEALKIVYADYDMVGPNRIPWQATPNLFGKGNVWFVESWTANGIGKLDPETGKVTEYKVPPAPGIRSLHVHSVQEGPDGMVWFGASRRCQLNKFDPTNQKFSAYPWPSCKQAKSYIGSGEVVGSNKVAVDRYGNIWSDGNALRRFDPKTEKIVEFPEGGHAYSFELDKKTGNVWFAQLHDGKIGMVDIDTLKLKSWTPPATTKLASMNKDKPDEDGNTRDFPKSSGPRRITSDSEGNIWFGEWWAGQIGRFDPKTETFKEFPLPNSDPSPYGIGVDHKGFVWYSSHHNDILGRLDPKTGKVIEFPFPYSFIGIREIIPDSEGRMWFGSPFNNKIGYFIPPEK